MTPMELRRVQSILTTLDPAPSESSACGTTVRCAGDAHRLLAPLLSPRPVEETWAVLLDARHRCIGLAQISVGTLTSSLVHPREVFGPAIRLGAAAILVAHNHPSGDPSPSADDIAVTRRLDEAGAILGIPLLDHVVIGQDGYCSLRDRVSSAPELNESLASR